MTTQKVIEELTKTGHLREVCVGCQCDKSAHKDNGCEVCWEWCFYTPCWVLTSKGKRE